MKTTCPGVISAGIVCGALVERGRCSRCRPIHERGRRGSTATRGYGSAWQRQSRDTIAAHRAEYGDICPGWGIPAHPSSDLTLDHTRDGDPSRTSVLCRGCNARKRNQQRHVSRTPVSPRE